MTELEVIDAHTHVLRSEAHGREMYSYFLNRSPANGHPADPSVFSTVDEVQELMRVTGVVHTNFLMFTWSGRYWRDGCLTLPDSGPRRAAAEEELRRRIIERVVDNNEWALGAVQEHHNLSFFCGIDAALMTEQELLSEIEDKTTRGALGVKMVPFDSRVRGDDRRLWPVYDWCQARGVPLLSESAGRPGPGRPPAGSWEESRAPKRGPAGGSRGSGAAVSCRSGRSGSRCPSRGTRRSRSTGSSGSRPARTR